MPLRVEFFHALSCPWSYLALVRLRETAARTGAEISYRPITGAASVHEPLLAADPAARAYAAKDLQDWARFCGVRISLPASWPAAGEWVAHSERAARGALLAIDAGVAHPYLEAIYRTQFSAGRGSSGPALVAEVAAGCGLGGPQLIAALEPAAPQNDALGARLRANEQALHACGGFRAPAMTLGTDLYVGHDRMPLLELALRSAGERSFVAPGEHGRRR